jgi:hypothetical protein
MLRFLPFAAQPGSMRAVNSRMKCEFNRANVAAGMALAAPQGLDRTLEHGFVLDKG